MRAFPWEQAIAFGLGVLRLTPDAFWRMTPRELAMVVRGLGGQHPTELDRQDFAALCARFPDRTRLQGDDHG